ncbi:MAG: hypothetical protein A3H32_13625 [Betaproteobacteria bacterium RIFCSPLOWO2_02_FULL_63_19]|nr:MAG: hypothetical protein A3H32_13625 [Betaproteobacteria bacterium RIFCSPLOWO2_02_FULL_63_19]
MLRELAAHIEQLLRIGHRKKLPRRLSLLVEGLARGFEVELEQLLGTGKGRLRAGDSGVERRFLPCCKRIGRGGDQGLLGVVEG